jgi:hypothetical protein
VGQRILASLNALQTLKDRADKQFEAMKQWLTHHAHYSHPTRYLVYMERFRSIDSKQSSIKYDANYSS